MPRRVRALVALAALAGCSLAGSDGNAKCANSCYCHSSGSAGSRPPPLLGASPHSPSLHAQAQAGCSLCKLMNATYGVQWDPRIVMQYIEPKWNAGVRSFNVESKLLGGDPALGVPKKLTITTTGPLVGDHVVFIERSGIEGSWVNLDECCRGN